MSSVTAPTHRRVSSHVINDEAQRHPPARTLHLHPLSSFPPRHTLFFPRPLLCTLRPAVTAAVVVRAPDADARNYMQKNYLAEKAFTIPAASATPPAFPHERTRSPAFPPSTPQFRLPNSTLKTIPTHHSPPPPPTPSFPLAAAEADAQLHTKRGAHRKSSSPSHLSPNPVAAIAV
ncbi:hypothetical protein R3P38DRAFT_3169473 [Favolaschia claudopus]|uniref:Uncharacterized protein n=1 Tax=Favolaschia claudopus TaxID=2862362 RepID=A0AAW0E2A4_9AGAR